LQPWKKAVLLRNSTPWWLMLKITERLGRSLKWTGQIG